MVSLIYFDDLIASEILILYQLTQEHQKMIMLYFLVKYTIHFHNISVCKNIDF